MLVHGVYTSPLEWWDDHWLKDRIAKPLVDAGITVPGITDGVPPAGLAPAAASAADPPGPRGAAKALTRRAAPGLPGLARRASCRGSILTWRASAGPAGPGRPQAWAARSGLRGGVAEASRRIAPNPRGPSASAR